MNEIITIVVPIYAASGCEAELEKRMLRLAESTRAEAGNICYRLHRGVEPGEFVIYEQWRNQSALDHHMAQKYLNDFLADEDKLLAKPIAGKMLREF